MGIGQEMINQHLIDSSPRRKLFNIEDLKSSKLKVKV
jgi:hypothetical protein